MITLKDTHTHTHTPHTDRHTHTDTHTPHIDTHTYTTNTDTHTTHTQTHTHHTHIQTHTHTLGMTPLDEGSARRKDFYLKTHDTRDRHPFPLRDSNPHSY